MVQEHERGLGGWHAEWETLPELCLLAAGALRHGVETVEGIQLDPARMRENIAGAGGQLFAEAAASRLTERLGREEAHRLVERAARRAESGGKHLRAVLEEDPAARQHLSAAELDAIFDTSHPPGSAGSFIDRVLARRRQRLEAR